MPEQPPIPTAIPQPTPVTGPVRRKERIEVLDILRGWAVFGMLLVNMSIDVGWSFLFEDQWQGAADRGALLLIRFFADDKFRALFSFLFGLGFALQLGRAEARGTPFFPRYWRRLFVLLLIGLLYILIQGGGILFIYAIFGFLLLLFRARSSRTLVIAALICLLIPWVHTSLVARRTYPLYITDPEIAQRAAQEAARHAAHHATLNEEELRVHSRGSFGEIVAEHAQSRIRLQSSLGFYLWVLGDVFPLFLLGLYAGQRRIFENIPAHLPLIRKVFWWGLGLGLVGTLVFTLVVHMTTPEDHLWPYFTFRVARLFGAVGAPALCFFYASVIILLAQREAWKKWLTPLAAVGRIALSNYLFQGLVFVLIFYSYGLGLYGQVGPLVGVSLAVLIFPVQVFLSMWWIRHFRFGPAEWLWRTLTYGKLQPMRV